MSNDPLEQEQNLFFLAAELGLNIFLKDFSLTTPDPATNDQRTFPEKSETLLT